MQLSPAFPEMRYLWIPCALLMLESAKTTTVEIVSLGISYPTTVASLCFNIGGVISGINYLRSAYNGTFQIKHTLLVDPRIKNPGMTDEECENMFAKWFYRKNSTADFTAFIAPSMFFFASNDVAH